MSVLVYRCHFCGALFSWYSAIAGHYLHVHNVRHAGTIRRVKLQRGGGLVRESYKKPQKRSTRSDRGMTLSEAKARIKREEQRALDEMIYGGY